jgi:hypothetical protein
MHMIVEERAAALPQTRPGPLGSPFASLSDLILTRALEGVPGAIALTITDRPSGTLILLVIEDETAATSAFEAFSQAVYRLGSPAYELICLTEAEAAKVEVSEQARVYRLS